MNMEKTVPQRQMSEKLTSEAAEGELANFSQDGRLYRKRRPVPIYVRTQNREPAHSRVRAGSKVRPLADLHRGHAAGLDSEIPADQSTTKLLYDSFTSR